MRTVIIDTNYVIALLDKSDYNHERAMRSLRKYNLDDTRFVMPIIVKVETIAGLKNTSLLHELIKGLNIEIDFITKTDIETIERIDYKLRKSLKAGDCLIYAASKRIGAEIKTYDEKFIGIMRKLS